MTVWDAALRKATDAEKDFARAAQSLMRPVMNALNARLPDAQKIHMAPRMKNFVATGGARHEATMNIVIPQKFWGIPYNKKIATVTLRSAAAQEQPDFARVRGMKIVEPKIGGFFERRAEEDKVSVLRLQQIMLFHMKRLPYMKRHGI